ncbi:hypothetical protein [uncultured Erythrobacter sp.]|uniref:hypothetical protein n=1 Tax=uncultured Erythrobacter sp. TaxID=263913 RepID=UPI00261920EF|nr:hypothetical protein [uncultured Erythrobacter sp.]
MTKQVQRALFPHLYKKRSSDSKAWPHNKAGFGGKRVVPLFYRPERVPIYRLFGTHWSFAIGGEIENSDDPNPHRRFKPTEFAALSPKANNGQHGPWDQNVFACDLYDEQSDKKMYPVQQNESSGGQPVGSHTALLVQQIILGQNNNPNLFQLVQGRIEVPFSTRHARWKTGRKAMLKRFCKELGLFESTQDASDDYLSIFLYPDGFCFFAAIKVPWRSGKAPPLKGWFKATTRPSPGQNEGNGELIGGLELCLDPALPGNSSSTGSQEPSLIAQWHDAAAELSAIFASRLGSSLNWLDVSAATPVDPARFFWRGEYDEVELRSKDYPASAKIGNLKRSESGALDLGADCLNIRLAPSGSQDEGSASYNVTGLGITIRSEEGTVVIKSHASVGGLDAADAAAETNVEYRFGANSATIESLALVSAKGEGNPVELAIPLIETAHSLRSSAGMPARAQPSGEITDDPVGAIWTFAPTDNGWLHFAFPDATLAGLDILLSHVGAEKNDGDTRAATDKTVSGGITIGNKPGTANFRAHERAWSLSATNGRNGNFELTLARETTTDGVEHWSVSEAKVTIEGASISLDGALMVTPFRQTPSRLLPGTAERALRAQSVAAYSPGLLRGVERDMWEYARKVEDVDNARFVRARMLIRGFEVLASQSETETPSFADAIDLDVDLKGHSPTAKDLDSIQPWLWTRHSNAPMMQNLALARSGKAASEPADERELLPFQGVGDERKFVIRFKNSLRMDRISAALEHNHDTVRFECALDTNCWVSELGMASLSLPSLSVFPQIDAGSSDHARISATAGFWPTAPEVPDEQMAWSYELRHDLAWRDGAHALATLAERAEDNDTANAGAIDQGIFAPTSDNGPAHIASAWRKLDRQAALAAADRRYLVSKTDGELKLTEDFSGFPVANVSFDLNIVLADTGNELKRIGQIQIERADDRTLVFDGLPSTSDLLGINGKLDDKEYLFGTADITAEVGLIDQMGRTLNGAKVDGPIWVRELAEDKKHLCSLRAEQTIDDEHSHFNGMRFHFANLVSGEASEAAAENWNDIDASDQSGGLWWLAHSSSDSGHPLVPWQGGLYFEPLRSAELAYAKGQPLTWKIEGRLGLLRGGEFLPQLNDDGGTVVLVIEARQATGWLWSAWIECSTVSLDLPLESPAVPVSLPRVGCRSDVERYRAAAPAILSCTIDASQAKPEATITDAFLHYDHFGTPKKAALVINGAVGGTGMKFELQVQPPPGGTENKLSLVRADLAIERSNVWLTLAYSFSVTLTEVATGAKNDKPTARAILSGGVFHPAYPNPEKLKLTIKTDDAGINTRRTATTTNHWEDLDPIVVLRRHVLCVAWDARWQNGGTASDTWLGTLEPAGCKGALAAVLLPGTTEASLPLGAVFMDAECRFSKAQDAVLRLGNDGDKGLSARLEGALAPLETEDGAGVTHRATVDFSGSRVSSFGETVQVPAHITHTLNTDLTFATLDKIELSSRSGSAKLKSKLVLFDPARGTSKLVRIEAERSLGGGSTRTLSGFAATLPPVTTAALVAPRTRVTEAIGSALGVSGWVERALGLDEGAELVFQPIGSDEKLEMIAKDFVPGSRVEAVTLSLPKSWKAGTSATWTDYRRHIVDQLAKIGLLAPGSAIRTDRGERARVLGLDAHKERIVAFSDVIGTTIHKHHKDYDAWLDSLFLYNTNSERAAISVSSSATGKHSYAAESRPVEAMRRANHFEGPWSIPAPVRTDARRSVSGSAGVETLSGGYRATSARALDLSFRPSSERSELDPIAPTVAAHALERQWSIERQDGENDLAQTFGESANFALTSRQGTAFRPAAEFNADQRLTSKLSKEGAAAAAPGLTPSAATSGLLEGWPSEPSQGEQYFAPDNWLERDVSGRAGAVSSKRLGLSVGVVKEKRRSVPPLPTGEMAFHARLPRPPQIGTSDRVAANQFNPRNMAMETAPTFFLYGERAKAPISRANQPALGREPFSTAMWKGSVVEPVDGVLSRSMSDRITIKVLPETPVPEGQRWILKDAFAVADGRTFSLSKVLPATTGSGQEFILELGSDFRAWLGGLEYSTQCQLEMRFNLAVPRAGPGSAYERVTRIVRLNLPVTASLASSLELPLYVNFEDPAFNEILSFRSRVSPTGLVAADRDKLNPSDNATLVWYRRAPDDGGAEDLEVQVTLFRKQDGTVPPDRIPLKPIQGWRVDDTLCAVLIDCASLQSVSPPSLLKLVVGDRLDLTVAVDSATGGREDEPMSFEVVGSDIVPANRSDYSLLKMVVGKESGVTCPLFVYAPRPDSFDLLDPRDLMSGRSQFLSCQRLTHFVEQHEFAERVEKPKRTVHFVVQKIAPDGGSHVPRSLAEWVKPVVK